jgi:signal transduction histidine kinase
LLGGLALRTTREQQIILERRTAELCQKETDAVATAARTLVADRRHDFSEAVRQLLAEAPAPALAARFSSALAAKWPQPAVGFALDPRGRVVAPSAADAQLRLECAQFLRDNRDFIASELPVPVYSVSMEELSKPDPVQRKTQQVFQQEEAPPTKDGWGQNAGNRRVAPMSNISNTYNGGRVMTNNAAADDGSVQQLAANNNEAPESQMAWMTAGFKELTAKESEGVVNRFVRDRLNMTFWIKPASSAGYLFGCTLRPEDLRGAWPALLTPSDGAEPDLILALLDDKARPAAVYPAGSTVPDWKRPFVATEIGEALPHWEAALYLRYPERLAASAQQVRRNLYLLISFALLAIAIGWWVVFADTRRQLALAQKKTDFVSNVSHELKTPLTSIRMFAELMHSGRAETERQPQYLRIIMVEAERLTRLINNVLDFARLERKQRRFEMRPLDLHKVLADLWPAQELHLREAGFTTHWEAAPPPYPIVGDEDALAQVIVNLLSNAEKYGGEQREITLHSYLEGEWACVSILDRGAGVPAGEEAKIFQPFYRAHDSLSSGIPGTGLGLALARRVVHEHRGEILYQERPGGGANFTIRLPLAGEGLDAPGMIPAEGYRRHFAAHESEEL